MKSKTWQFYTDLQLLRYEIGNESFDKSFALKTHCNWTSHNCECESITFISLSCAVNWNYWLYRERKAMYWVLFSEDLKKWDLSWLNEIFVWNHKTDGSVCAFMLLLHFFLWLKQTPALIVRKHKVFNLSKLVF